jgi:glutamate synthase domain-containing protein 1
MAHGRAPEKQGLYDPRFEHDACGVGFVCNIDGRKSHDLVQKGLQVLVNLTHRGAAGSDPDTGDGAGILMQIPHRFFMRECARLGIALPPPGEYGVGMFFLPQDERQRARCEELVAEIVAAEGQTLLGWREVPVDADAIGRTARAALPVIQQVFVLSGPGVAPGDAFERKLFVIRKCIEAQVARESIEGFHVPTFSSRTICYKGLLR